MRPSLPHQSTNCAAANLISATTPRLAYPTVPACLLTQALFHSQALVIVPLCLRLPAVWLPTSARTASARRAASSCAPCYPTTAACKTCCWTQTRWEMRGLPCSPRCARCAVATHKGVTSHRRGRGEAQRAVCGARGGAAQARETSACRPWCAALRARLCAPPVRPPPTPPVFCPPRAGAGWRQPADHPQPLVQQHWRHRSQGPGRDAEGG